MAHPEVVVPVLAIDAIAIEMERIGESQRFLTKILAERPTAPREIS